MLEVSNISLYENPTVAELARELLLYRMQEYSERCVRRGYPMFLCAPMPPGRSVLFFNGNTFADIGQRLAAALAGAA